MLTPADIEAAAALVKEDQSGAVKDYPPEIKDRVAHIDADFLAYMVSYERADENLTFQDIQYRADVMVEDKRRLAGAQRCVLHLTPNTSNKGGRYDAAVQQQYQGARTNKDKPRHLEDVRRYMGNLNTPTITGVLWHDAEADDGMAQAAWQAYAEGRSHEVVIVTKDKDLRMCPGLHLNWDTGNIHDCGSDLFGWVGIKVRERTNSAGKIVKTKKHDGFGTKFFWLQMLMGDTADTIKGCPKIMGPTGSMVNCGLIGAHALLDEATTDRECLRIVMDQYKLNEYTDWENKEPVSWQDVFWGEAKLLWMQRRAGDIEDVKSWVKEFLNEKN